MKLHVSWLIWFLRCETLGAPEASMSTGKASLFLGYRHAMDNKWTVDDYARQTEEFTLITKSVIEGSAVLSIFESKGRGWRRVNSGGTLHELVVFSCTVNEIPCRYQRLQLPSSVYYMRASQNVVLWVYIEVPLLPYYTTTVDFGRCCDAQNLLGWHQVKAAKAGPGTWFPW